MTSTPKQTKSQWSTESTIENNPKPKSQWKIESTIEDIKLRNFELVNRILNELARLEFTEAEKYCVSNGLIPIYMPTNLELDLLSRIRPNASHNIYLKDAEEKAALANLIQKDYAVKGPYNYHLTPLGIFFLGPDILEERLQ